MGWIRSGDRQSGISNPDTDSAGVRFARDPDVPERSRRPAADGATYRVDHEAPERRWNPYAPDQSRSSRARDARQRAKARPIARPAPDYYVLLGVPADASTLEIERAYRRHAAIVHPDRFFDQPSLRLQAEAKLRQLNEAATVLRDPERRVKYDAEWRLR
jgi:DnaJ-domain-containing protein 1